ncbi:ABC transporter substrate-binding protein [Microbacteriaceae bacterium K1510]|nr:ABC transporter substrate-binding protein [Microbacteriaceae bacterium K1510]
MKRLLGLAAALALPIVSAQAEDAVLTIGATVSATGPAASLGISEKNTIELLPKAMGSVAVRYIILDDGGDPGRCVRNAKQLVEEYKADVIFGSSTIPCSIAIGDVANQTKTTQIALAPIHTSDYVFSLPQTADLMVSGLVDHMKAKGVKQAAYLGFADSLGDHNYASFLKFAEPAGIKVSANERFARNDTSVTAQVLHVMQVKPDAVFISASGTPAALPAAELKQRGYKGQIYFLHGAINSPFLRVGAKNVEGTIATAGPFSVARELPDSNPIKAHAMALINAYESKHGTGSADAFAAYAWDAHELVKAVLPQAMAKAKPGTPEFRVALHDALEASKEVAGAGAIYTMSASNHNGIDNRARVLVGIKDNKFFLLQ